MIKPIIYFSLLLSFISCRTYRMLDGKSRPVYFTPDVSVFSDSDFYDPNIAYTDLHNLGGNSLNTMELKKGKTSVAIIHQPTFFLAHDNFLVYPGEHIIIKKGVRYDFTFTKKHGSKRRNRELSFFKTYSDNVRYPVIPGLHNYSLDTILILEKKVKSEIPQFALKSKQLFDSLAKACRVSIKFKKIAGDYLGSAFNGSLYMLYRQYKDTLEAHNLYQDKCKQLIPVFNNITQKSKFEGVQINFNELANVVLPYKIWKITKEVEFQSCFDSVKNNFSALAGDYLLSQLMYRAYTKRIPVSSEYMAQYETICSDKTYKKLIYNLKSQQERNDYKTTVVGNNSLLSVDGKTIASLENILTKHKGKLIIIDFWATWCAPCREEMPNLRKLVREYPEDKVVFLRISIEREIQTWQKYVIANAEVKNNYLLTNLENSSFAKKFGINSIPRYMIVDKEGQIINADAPRPSDQKLKALLNKYLQE